MKVFPTCLFAPNGTEADIELRTISGGTAISGDETLIGTDGGGRVFVELEDFYLDDPETALAWSAISAWMDGGLRPMIVPICDAIHQPTNGFTYLPHSDDTPFSDESLYEQGDCVVHLAADAALRATTLYLDITELGRPLVGGEWLSIDHETWRWRAYKIAEIIAQDATSATITIRPPLREAAAEGAEVDFNAPRCVMHLSGEMRAPRNMGYAEGQPLRFVEDMTGSYT